MQNNLENIFIELQKQKEKDFFRAIFSMDEELKKRNEEKVQIINQLENARQEYIILSVKLDDLQKQSYLLEEENNTTIVILTENLNQKSKELDNLSVKLQDFVSKIQFIEGEKKILAEQIVQQREKFFDQYAVFQKELVAQVGVLNQKDILLREKEEEKNNLVEQFNNDIFKKDSIISDLQEKEKQQVSFIQLKDQEIVDLQNNISRLLSVISNKDGEILLMQVSKFWKLRDVYLRSKWAILNPLKFSRKYIWKSIPIYSQIKWAITNPRRFIKKYLGISYSSPRHNVVSTTYTKEGRRILWIVPGICISGGLRTIFEIANIQSKNNYVEIISFPSPGIPIDWMEIKFCLKLFSDNSKKNLKSYINNQNFDVVFATGYQTAEFVSELSIKNKIYYVQDYEPYFPLANKKVAKQSYDLFDNKIVINEWIREKILKYNNTNSLIIRNGTKLYSNINFNKSEKLIVFCYYKGEGLLQRGSDIIKKVVHLLNEKGIQVKVIGHEKSPGDCEFLGELKTDQLIDLYKKAHIFIDASRHRGCPTMSMEAAQFGVVSVMTHKEIGCAEYGFDETNSVFSSENPNEIVKKVLLLLSDKKHLDYLSKNVKELSKTFDFNKVERKIDQAIQIFERKEKLTPANIAVFVHLYYVDLWPEIKNQLLNIFVNFDLYITVSDNLNKIEYTKILNDIHNFYPRAQVIKVKNKGLDIGAFFDALNLVFSLNKSYNYFLKIHTKKSIHVDPTIGENHRKHTYDNLLGSPLNFISILEKLKEGSIGMIGAMGTLMSISPEDKKNNKNNNEKYLNEYRKRLNIQDDQILCFGGTMFWAQWLPFERKFKKFKITSEEFENGYASDGLRAHAFERLFANIIRDENIILIENSKEDNEKKIENNLLNDLSDVANDSISIIKKRILVIDEITPMPDRDAGSAYVFNIMKIFVGLNYHVTFIPWVNTSSVSSYTERLQAIGVESLHVPQIISVDDFLKTRGREYDIIMFVRMSTASKYSDIVRLFCPQVKTILNTIDLHYLRFERHAEQKNDHLLREEAEKLKKTELSVIEKADRTMVVSSAEQKILAQELPNSRVEIVHLMKDIPNYTKRLFFSKKCELLFIGGFNHSPNVDAVLWFCKEIFPLILKEIPYATLNIVGSNPPIEIQELATERVIVCGYVQNLDTYLHKATMTIAPIRFGAGQKGKILDSLLAGIPCVTTSIGAEGMNLLHDKEVLIADTAEDFAKLVLRLYKNKKLWHKLSLNGYNLVKKEFSTENGVKRIRTITEDLLQEDNVLCKTSDSKKEIFRGICLKYLPELQKKYLPLIKKGQKKEAVIIETRVLPHIESIIRNAILKLGLHWSFTIMCGTENFEFVNDMCKRISRNIKVINLGIKKIEIADYSPLLASQKFWDLLEGEKILIYQEDTMIFRDNIDEFLKWDYIGAPWPKNESMDWRPFVNENFVGNGGLSLRTKSVMVDVINQYPYAQKNREFFRQCIYEKNKGYDVVPEEIYFSYHIDKYNLGKVALHEEAVRFAIEYIDHPHAFGGHCFWYAKENWEAYLTDILLDKAYIYTSNLIEPPKLNRFFIDCTFVYNHQYYNTGIQRVVKNIIKNIFNDYKEYNPVIVVWENNILYRVEYQSSLDPLSKSFSMERKEGIEPCQGDTLILLDLHWNIEIFPKINEFKKRGVSVVGVIYDLIPIMYPQYNDEHAIPIFKQWIANLIEVSDGLMFISKDAQIEVENYTRELIGEKKAKEKWYDYFHLGSDFTTNIFNPEVVRVEIKDFFRNTSPVFLMVSTIEPRKNHTYLLDVFDKLWAEGFDVRLCFIGRLGWKYESILDRIHNHQELNKKFLMINDASDEELEFCYKYAKSLLFPSHAEGFGLPIVEALQRGLPAMISDIPVFREVAGDYAAYFNQNNPQSLVSLIKDFITNNKFPAVKTLKNWSWINWKESSKIFMERIIKHLK